MGGDARRGIGGKAGVQRRTVHPDADFASALGALVVHSEGVPGAAHIAAAPGARLQLHRFANCGFHFRDFPVLCAGAVRPVRPVLDL